MHAYISTQYMHEYMYSTCQYMSIQYSTCLTEQDIEGQTYWNEENSDLRMQRDISEEYSVLPSFSPPAAPTPSAPLQPCSMLAGVFLYKRPILWDARIAMEAFDGHHTKAQTQRGKL